MKISTKLFLGTIGLNLSSFGVFCVKNIMATTHKIENPDYVLILGTKVEVDKASELLKFRINKAVDYLKENPNAKAICCGGIVLKNQKVSEASVIKNGLIKGGIDESRIILEDKSMTTLQNFINAKKIIFAENVSDDTKIAYLSSNTHLFRAGVIAKKAGIKAVGVPAPSPKYIYLPALIREYLVFPLLYKETHNERKNKND